MNTFIKAARHILRYRVKRAESLPLVGQERPKVSPSIPNSPGDILNSYNLPGNTESVPITGKYFVPKGMNYLEPGVYAIDSGMLPFNWARNTGINNRVRHSLAATIHDSKPPVKDAIKLPNGQWATYFSSTSGDTAQSKNFPVWNGRQGGVTGESEHYGNDYILNTLVDPKTRLKWGGSWHNVSNLNPTYTQILPGEDSATVGSLLFEDLYRRNKGPGFGRYVLNGNTGQKNNCTDATAFAISQFPRYLNYLKTKLPDRNLPEMTLPDRVGALAGVPKDQVMAHENFGYTDKNNQPTNPNRVEGSLLPMIGVLPKSIWGGFNNF